MHLVPVCIYAAAAAAALFPQKIEEIVSDEDRDEECLCAIREMESWFLTFA